MWFCMGVKFGHLQKECGDEMVEPKRDEIMGGWELEKLAHWGAPFGFLTKY